MGIDVNMVHNIASGLAARARTDANRGKHVNQKGWVTKEDMRKDAAQKTIAILVIIFLVTILFKILIFLGKLSIKLFGPKLGWTINIVGLILLIAVPAYQWKTCEDRHMAEVAVRENEVRISEIKEQEQEQAEQRQRMEKEAEARDEKERLDALMRKANAEINEIVDQEMKKDMAEAERIRGLKQQAEADADELIRQLNQKRMKCGGAGIDCDGIRKRMYQKYGIDVQKSYRGSVDIESVRRKVYEKYGIECDR